MGSDADAHPDAHPDHRLLARVVGVGRRSLSDLVSRTYLARSIVD